MSWFWTSTPGCADQQRAFVHDMHSARVPVVVMADDDHREAAMDLVQRGAYDYFRKPPCSGGAEDRRAPGLTSTPVWGGIWTT